MHNDVYLMALEAAFPLSFFPRGPVTKLSNDFQYNSRITYIMSSGDIFQKVRLMNEGCELLLGH